MKINVKSIKDLQKDDRIDVCHRKRFLRLI